MEVVLKGDGLNENAEEESEGEEVADDGCLAPNLGELDEETGGKRNQMGSEM